MSISGQQQINVGLPNESANSDSLYTAFNKVNTNFNNLFDNASPYNTFNAGDGINVEANANIGTVTITNDGVTNIIAGTNIVINRSSGNVTISAIAGGNGGGGTLSSVGLTPSSRLTVTNSPLVADGNMSIDLATSGVTSGTYNNPTLTIDQYGRITSASNNTVSGTVTSVGLTAGSGIQINGGPITSNGNITVTNTGVTRLNPGPGISLSGSNGNITISTQAGGGTITYVGIISNSLTVTGSPITSSGSISVELPANSTFTGNITAANANLGNLATANYFQGDGSLLTNVSVAAGTSLVNGTSNIFVDASGNVRTSVAGTANVLVVRTAGANISGTLNVTGNANTGNLGTGRVISSGNISATQFISNIATGTAPLVVTSTTQVANLNAATSGTAGTVTTAAQPNITSVGTLTTLAVTGNANVGNLGTTALVATGNITSSNANLGNLAKANYFQGDGGLLSNISVGAGTSIVNGTSNVAVSLNGNVQISVGGTPNVLVVTSTGANLSGVANITGNLIAANVFANSGTVRGSLLTGTLTTAAQPNITSVGTLSTLSVTGNVTAGNVYAVPGIISGTTLGGNLTTNAQPNITSVGTLISLSVTGNANVGNIGTAQVLATANVTAPQFISNVAQGTAPFVVTSSTTVANLTANVALLAQALLQNTSTATTVYPTFTTSGANGNSSAVINTSISANLGNASITATTFVGALSGAATSATTAGTLTTASQPNITSASNLVTVGNITSGTWSATLGAVSGANLSSINAANVTGTFSSVTISGNMQAANVISTSYNIRSINASVAAAGSTQGTATALTKEINVISTVTSGANGVVLPTAVAGMVLIVNNTSANTLNVYPASGGVINSGSTNAAYSHVSNASLQYYATSSTQWYTVGATYV
jgi:hypothetical protein